jgi:sRNA-binding carbon storage regulator CsrA
MPLILGRKAGQKIVITIDPAADPQELLRALQADGIEIAVKDIGDHGTYVRLMIDAPRELLVLRAELVSTEEPYE